MERVHQQVQQPCRCLHGAINMQYCFARQSLCQAAHKSAALICTLQTATILSRCRRQWMLQESLLLCIATGVLWLREGSQVNINQLMLHALLHNLYAAQTCNGDGPSQHCCHEIKGICTRLTAFCLSLMAATLLTAINSACLKACIYGIPVKHQGQELMWCAGLQCVS